ncbi:uncharacterized protein [Macrobrachium rosenbergii]|uniref:uncharacterized protein n=1 Tax=Macrobrachium rosenbergii TaxID=79674 RepID=UPI0034D5F23D
MNVRVSCSGAVLSSLLYEQLRTGHAQEGFLLGSVENHISEHISDSQICNEKMETTISISSFLPCTMIGSFYSGAGELNNEKLSGFLGTSFQELLIHHPAYAHWTDLLRGTFLAQKCGSLPEDGINFYYFLNICSPAVPPDPLPSSHTSNPNAIANLESRFDRKFELIVSSMAQPGSSVCTLMDQVNKGGVISASAVLVEELAARPADSPKQNSLAHAPESGRSHTRGPREVRGVCPWEVSPVAPVAKSQGAIDSHWKGIFSEVHRLSSSSEASSPDVRCQWHKSDKSRPLKRPAIDVSHTPQVPSKNSHSTMRKKPLCSFWDSPEHFSPVCSDSKQQVLPPKHLYLAYGCNRFVSPVDATVSEHSFSTQRRLDDILGFLKKPPPAAKPAADAYLSPVLSNEEESNKDVEEDSTPSAYVALRFLLRSFPAFFSPVAPSTHRSTFLMSNQPAEHSRLPKMVLSTSTRKALSEADAWLSVKREQGEASFIFPPAHLSHRRYSSHATGEAPSLGAAASSQGDFSGLINSSRGSTFSLAKVMFSSAEIDHLLRNLYKVFKSTLSLFEINFFFYFSCSLLETFFIFSQFEGLPLQVINMGDTSTDEYRLKPRNPALYKSMAVNVVLSNLNNSEPGIMEAENLHTGLLQKLDSLLPRFSNTQKELEKILQEVTTLRMLCCNNGIPLDFTPENAILRDDPNLMDFEELSSSPLQNKREKSSPLKSSVRKKNTGRGKNPKEEKVSSDPFGFVNKEMEKLQVKGRGSPTKRLNRSRTNTPSPGRLMSSARSGVEGVPQRRSSESAGSNENSPVSLSKRSKSSSAASSQRDSQDDVFEGRSKTPRTLTRTASKEQNSQSRITRSQSPAVTNARGIRSSKPKKKEAWGSKSDSGSQEF